MEKWNRKKEEEYIEKGWEEEQKENSCENKQDREEKERIEQKIPWNYYLTGSIIQ